jgi:DNA-binding beta-propeller fold protein YncE
MPRSLGTIYGGAVTRFLGGALRGVVSRVIDAPGGAVTWSNGIAVSVDGGTLLMSDPVLFRPHVIHEFCVADGSRRRVVGGRGYGPLQFNGPRQVYVAPDGFVFVADTGNNRVQVLTPTLDFHCFIGQGEVVGLTGVCANADVVVASEFTAPCISVFDRRDGALLRRFGCDGDDVEVMTPCGLCFLSGDRHVAVADRGSNRVSVFSVDGHFIRHVGVGVLSHPQGVAASAFDELVVADSGNRCLRVFSDTGELLAKLGDAFVTGVAVHGSTVFAAIGRAETVLVFQ